MKIENTIIRPNFKQKVRPFWSWRVGSMVKSMCVLTED